MILLIISLNQSSPLSNIIWSTLLPRLCPPRLIIETVFSKSLLLTCIHGEPSFEAIRQLHQEVMTKAQTVLSNLGGGVHGHLGLLLSPKLYVLLDNATYVHVPHPGKLVIPVQHNIMEEPSKNNFKNASVNFRKSWV